MKKDSRHILLLISFILHGFGISNSNAQDFPMAGEWYNSMTIRQKVGQLFLAEISEESSKKDIEEIRSKIAKGELGGVIYKDINKEEIQESILGLSGISQRPFLFGLDCSNGFPDLFRELKIPPPAVMASISDPKLVTTAGYLIGKELRKLGVNFIIGPNVLTYSGVGSYQTFYGEELQDVVREIEPFWIGLESSGLKSVLNIDANFFRGAENGVTISEEKQVNREAIESLFQMNMDMISFSNIPISSKTGKIENEESRVDFDFIENIRKEYKYSGLAISESVFDQRSTFSIKKDRQIWDHYKMGFNMIRVKKLGRSVFKSLQKHLSKDGDMANLEKRVGKILELKLGLPLKEKPMEENEKIYSYSLTSLFSEIWNNSVVMVDRGSLLPIQRIEGVHVGLLEIVGQEENSLKSEFEKFYPIDHFLIDLNVPDSGLLSLKGFQEKNGILFLNISKNDLSIPQIDLLVKSLQRFSFSIVYCFQEPAQNYEGVKTALFSIESNLETRKSIAEIAFGGRSSQGRLPFSFSGFKAGEGSFSPRIDRIGTGIPEKRGMDSEFLLKINEILEEGMRDSATPGGQVMILRGGDIIFNKGFGYATYDDIRSIEDEDLYDIASITKVSGTLQVIMSLVGWGSLDIEKPASFYLSELVGSNKENILVKDILVHEAGLLPYIPFWAQIKSRSDEQDFFYCEFKDNWFCIPVAEDFYTIASIKDSLWLWTIDSDLLDLPEDGKFGYKYSDLSFYILKEIAERITNQPIEDFLEQNFWDPMGIWRMTYNPLNHFEKNEIIPTEQDFYFRNQIIQGTVHDQGAALLGGVGGHAGIFSNSLELSKVFQMNMNSGHYGGQNYFYSKTVEGFTIQDREKNRRGLGWDKPNPYGEGPTSELCSYETFGHSGFTGTAAWADPEFDLVYVFLSNRVYPDASNRKLIKQNIRTRIQDLVYESIFHHELNEQ